KIYGKTVSFLYGWASFTVIQTAAISSIAFVFAGALATFIPLPQLPESLTTLNLWGIISPFDNFGGKLIACLLIIILTVVNVRGTKQGGNRSLLFTVIIILCILSIALLAFFSEAGSATTFSAPAFHVENLSWVSICGIM